MNEIEKYKQAFSHMHSSTKIDMEDFTHMNMKRRLPKRTVVLIAAIIAAFMLSAIAGYAISMINTSGNTTNNMNNSMATRQGEWVYFSAPIWYGGTTGEFLSYPIIKMREDGSEWQVVTVGRSSHINVVGDWIYYIENDFDENNSIFSHLCKIRTDGADKQIIAEDASELIISDEYIYYTTYLGWFYEWETKELYKMALDGSDKTLVSNDADSIVAVSDGWIYYTVGAKPCMGSDSIIEIYRVRTDGSDQQLIADDLGRFATLHGDWIYYGSGNWNCGKIVRVKSDGSEREIILNSTGYANMTTDGEWVYYDNLFGQLRKVRVDGTGDQRLAKCASETSSPINLIGDWIYFVGYNGKSSSETFCRVSTDGIRFQAFVYPEFQDAEIIWRPEDDVTYTPGDDGSVG